MKYRLVVITILTASLLAGCSKNESTNAFLQQGETIGSIEINGKQPGKTESAVRNPEITEYVTLQPTKQPTVTEIPQPTKRPMVTETPQPMVTETPQPTKQPTVTETPQPTKQPTVTETPQPTQKPTITVTPSPTQTPGNSSTSQVVVRGEKLMLGDSKSSVIQKFGNPSRIDETEYTYDFMVYTDDYKEFVMIAIDENQVVGWYTDATNFSFRGLTSSSGISAINSTFGKSLSMNRTLSVKDGTTSVVFFMDTLGDNTIDGILVTSTSVRKETVTDNVLRAWEKEIFDLTNSFRTRNNLSTLVWSDGAAKTARFHSKDMADNNYFSHTGLNGSSPSDRLKAQGVSFTMSGENIIGGYGNAMYSSNGWMNSSGHRLNMLNKSYVYLGIGYALGGNYGNYATQNFYK